MTVLIYRGAYKWYYSRQHMVSHTAFLFSKRCFDVLLSLAGLLLLCPVFILISLAIFITSGSPVFFRQLRVGKNGVNFKIIKFRTMSPGADTGSPVTSRNDGRITGFGKILRAAKLDELPQLLNVLAGHMSIVGPRPEIPELAAFYSQEQRKLLSVKPGITSPATIYHRDEEEVVDDNEKLFEYHRRVLVPKKASFDLAYVDKVSFLYDIKIILLTLVSVITNQSGYMRERALKNRKMLIFLTHICMAVIAYYLAFVIRFDASVPYHEYLKFQRTLPLAVLIQIIYLSLFGLTQGYWRYVGLDDIKGIGKAVFCSSVTLAIVELLLLDPAYPTGVIVINGVFCFVAFSGLRFSTRFLREAYYPMSPKTKEHILLLGASDRADALIREIRRDPDLGIDIVGLVDKDPGKRGSTIQGIKILGTLESIKGILREGKVDSIINTYPSLSRNDTTELAKIAASFNLKVKSIPSFSDVISGNINLNSFRELKYEELLGREEVQLDRELLKKIYQGKKILITGAGGSIGSELVRQVSLFAPGELILLDKDESLLYEIKLEMAEKDPGLRVTALIGDIRNTGKLNHFFTTHQPQIVLHSAAYKHVPLLEEHPQEAYYNNVLGTRNLLQTSVEHRVERFVMISTDKAVKPTNVMGATKAMAEKLMFDVFSKQSGMKCMAVRFGNVLGSRGSVIPIFKRQIEAGGPVRITHEEVTRYFMSIPEAAQLVLQAGAMGTGNEIFILKMGDPVKIRDLAERMILHSGHMPDVDVRIEYTGLRHGEKMYEELLTDLENSQTTEHEKIFVIRYSPNGSALTLDTVNLLEENLYSRTNGEIRKFLQAQVKDYQPNNPVN